jgi:hypothetical protein
MLSSCGLICFSFSSRLTCVIYLPEMLMRILYRGFLFTNIAFMKDPWGQLDFFVVMSNVATVVLQWVSPYSWGSTFNLANFDPACRYVVTAKGSSSINKLKVLRGFRALRPLRALKKVHLMQSTPCKISSILVLCHIQSPELRNVVQVIGCCIPVFLNLALCNMVFYTVAGVIMNKLFAGRFWQCNDPTVRFAYNFRSNKHLI